MIFLANWLTNAPLNINFPYFTSLVFLDKDLARAENVTSNAKDSDTFVSASQWQISQRSKKRKSDEVIIPELDQFAKKKYN